MNKLLILGAGGNGKVCAEIASLSKKYEEICFLDDNSSIKDVLGFKVIGRIKQWKEFSDYDYFVSIGDNIIRGELIESINCLLTTLIHPTATVSSHAKVSDGTVIMAGAIIMPGSSIGRGCIINNGTTVDHDCIIDNFAHLSPGVNIAGGSVVGKFTWIGLGANIINNVNIGNNVIVGAGATVIRNIDNDTIAVGVPAKPKETNSEK